MNYLVAAAAGVGASVYTFWPLIQSRHLESAKEMADKTASKTSHVQHAAPVAEEPVPEIQQEKK